MKRQKKLFMKEQYESNDSDAKFVGYYPSQGTYDDEDDEDYDDTDNDIEDENIDCNCDENGFEFPAELYV